jgi:hypothetical protein
MATRPAHFSGFAGSTKVAGSAPWDGGVVTTVGWAEVGATGTVFSATVASPVGVRPGFPKGTVGSSPGLATEGPVPDETPAPEERPDSGGATGDVGTV